MSTTTELITLGSYSSSHLISYDCLISFDLPSQWLCGMGLGLQWYFCSYFWLQVGANTEMQGKPDETSYDIKLYGDPECIKGFEYLSMSSSQQQRRGPEQEARDEGSQRREQIAVQSQQQTPSSPLLIPLLWPSEVKTILLANRVYTGTTTSNKCWQQSSNKLMILFPKAFPLFDTLISHFPKAFQMASSSKRSSEEEYGKWFYHAIVIPFYHQRYRRDQSRELSADTQCQMV